MAYGEKYSFAKCCVAWMSHVSGCTLGVNLYNVYYETCNGCSSLYELANSM